jgi:hypothetical protein
MGKTSIVAEWCQHRNVFYMLPKMILYWHPLRNCTVQPWPLGIHRNMMLRFMTQALQDSLLCSSTDDTAKWRQHSLYCIRWRYLNQSCGSVFIICGTGSGSSISKKCWIRIWILRFKMANFVKKTFKIFDFSISLNYFYIVLQVFFSWEKSRKKEKRKFFRMFSHGAILTPF